MLPHARVHRRSNEHRRSHSQMKCGQEIIGNAGRQAGNTIGRSRRDEKKIDGLGYKDVIESAFKVAARVRTFKHLCIDFVAGKRAKRERRHKLHRALRHQDGDINSAVLKAAHDLCRLITGDAATDAERYSHDLFFLRYFFLRRAVALRDPELHESLKNFFLRNLSRFVAGFFQLRRAAALDLARTQCGENYKAIFTVDIIGNGNQAKPPNEAIIPSIRPC